MTVYYNRTKSMKSVKIGTIMPWAGDGNDGFLLSNIPKGWLLCDGKTYLAKNYPLLASLIADSYGGTNFTVSSTSGNFPAYNSDVTFVVPNLTARCLMDLELSMITNTKYQYGQSDCATVLGTKVSDYGTTVSIPTLISANADINFTIDSTLVFTGKMTEITITDPDFNATINTVNRKLGINHTPGHNHPGTLDSIEVDGSGPMLFEPSKMKVSGTVTNQCPSTKAFTSCEPDNDRGSSWQNGFGNITYYGSETREDTLPDTSTFKVYNSISGTKDYSLVPAQNWPSSLNSNFLGSSYTTSFSNTTIKTHQQPAWTGMFPKPGTYFNKRNYFGINTDVTGDTGIQDDPEAVTATTFTSVTIGASASKFSLPAGSNIGTSFDKIKPFMLISDSGGYIPSGTQVLNIIRTGGTSTSNYVYEIELSASTTNTTSQSSLSVTFRHGTYPTTMNNLEDGQDPNSDVFKGHNHGSFEIQMSKGSLSGPATYPVSNISIGSVAPQNINDALNIIADITAPSLSLTYIIKAY